MVDGNLRYRDQPLPACHDRKRQAARCFGIACRDRLALRRPFMVNRQVGHKTILPIRDAARASITTPTMASRTFQAAGRAKSGIRMRAP